MTKSYPVNDLLANRVSNKKNRNLSMPVAACSIICLVLFLLIMGGFTKVNFQIFDGYLLLIGCIPAIGLVISVPVFFKYNKIIQATKNIFFPGRKSKHTAKKFLRIVFALFLEWVFMMCLSFVPGVNGKLVFFAAMMCCLAASFLLLVLMFIEVVSLFE